MANHIQTTNLSVTGSPAITLAAGDMLYVLAGVNVTSTDQWAVEATAGSSTMVIEGTLFGGLYGILSGGLSTATLKVLVANTGRIEGFTGGILVTSTGRHVQIENHGEINGVINAIEINPVFADNYVINTGTISGANYGIRTVGSMTVQNTGTITGGASAATGAALSLLGGNNFVTNSGSIEAGIGEGIAFGSNGTNNVLHNSGHISASGFAGVDATDSGTAIDNSGTISGGKYAIYLNNGGDTVTNSGMLTNNSSGFAVLYDFFGDNTIDNSGTIHGANTLNSGILISGTGSNRLTNSGTITVSATAISLAGDTNTISSSGTISGNQALLLSGNNNDVTNTGKISGKTSVISVTGNGNAVTNSGTITGNDNLILMSTSSGSNQIYNSGEILARHSNYGITGNGAGALTVVNDGHIAGSIFFSSGSDSYDGTGGTTTGTVFGNDGNDTLIGGASPDKFDTGGGSDTVNGAGGNDLIVAGPSIFNTANLDAADRIDGGDGNDTLTIGGPANVTLTDDTLASIEKIVFSAGFSYKLFTADGTIAEGGRMVVDGSALSSANTITLDASAETDGRAVVTGGAGIDSLLGGALNDNLKGGSGDDRLTGNAGADRLDGGVGHDRFIYKLLGDSTGANHDIINGFAAGADTVDFTFAVTGVDASVTTGVLGLAHFDSDLATAIGAGQLAASHAVLFTPNLGNQHGHVFLIVDANGVAGYQEGQDYVIEMTNGPASLTTANFV